MAVPITGSTLDSQIEEVCAQLCESCIASAEYSDNMRSEIKELQGKCPIRKHFPQFVKCTRDESATETRSV